MRPSTLLRHGRPGSRRQGHVGVRRTTTTLMMIGPHPVRGWIELSPHPTPRALPWCPGRRRRRTCPSAVLCQMTADDLRVLEWAMAPPDAPVSEA
eukprot:2780155-Rhodomonas_salina.1